MQRWTGSTTCRPFSAFLVLAFLLILVPACRTMDPSPTHGLSPTDPIPTVPASPTDPVPVDYGESNGDGTRSYYVDAVSGSRNGAGTQSSPFSLLSHAIKRAIPGDTVFIGQGVHVGTSHLRSGEEGKPITLAAWGDAKPVLTTTVASKGTWELYEGDIHSLDVSPFVHLMDEFNPQVFLEGEALVEARYPNMGPYLEDLMDYRRAVAQKGTDRNTLVAPDDLPGGLEGALAVVWPGTNGLAGWVAWTSPVLSVDGRTIRLEKTLNQEETVTGGDAYTPYPGNPFYLKGALSLLDAPGEYHYDRENRTLYLYLPGGGDPNSRDIRFRGANSAAIEADGKSHIHLKGLTFLGCGIRMSASNHIVMEDCTVRYADHFQGTGYASYALRSHMILVGDHNTIRRCAFGPTAGSGIILGGRDVLFTDCIIRNSNGSGNDFSSLKLLESADLVISHSTFQGTSSNHIGFEPGKTFGKCIVEYNHFMDHATLNSDMGAVSSWSTDGGKSEIRYNLVETGNRNDNGTMMKLTIGLYIDNYCSNFLVHHNIVIGGEGGLQTNLPNPGTIFANNTVIGAKHGYGLFSVSKDNADGRGVSFVNNLFADLKGLDISYYGTEDGISRSYLGNLADGSVPVPVNPDRRITSSHNLRGEVGADYRPVPGSSAIDGGIVIDGITGDFSGNAPDIGALESGEPMFPYGASWTLP